jgi:hypothetical protein
MTTNPSHILIARNSRGQSNAPLSSPTETHAAAAGIFRSSAGSPPWFFEGVDTEDAVSEVSVSDSQEPIDVDEAFTKHSKFPGTVKIVVESTTFWCVRCLRRGPPIRSIADLSWCGFFFIIIVFFFYPRAHKEVLWFASPFFQAALSGNWAETGRPLSMSSVITISQPPVVPGDKIHPDAPTAMTFARMDPDLDPDGLDIDVSESSEPEVLESSTTSTIVVRSGEEDEKKVHGSAAAAESRGGTREEAEAEKKAHEAARMESLEKLQRGAAGNAAAGSAVDSPRGSDKGRGKGIVKLSWKRGNAQVSARHQPTTSNPDAVVVLKEEKVRVSSLRHSRPVPNPHLVGSLPQASTFHDFLRFVYPGYALSLLHKRACVDLSRSMECTITWNNVEGLMNIGNKLCVPSLQRVCMNFLLTHAAGRPIKAMRIAEIFEEEELYREASRFVLDNPGGWPEQELNTLSSDTLLKLEKR